MSLNLFYFASTHWDREWYSPFQVFRGHLLENAERIAETLEKDPEFRFFHFDGQTIVLEDVEEVNPELAERLYKLIRDGRLMVGPWYLMPDELLVSGESLIRNFQRGFRIARSHGAEPWKVGYACDIFGHIAQFPQILKGFGIQTAVIWRGIDENQPAYLVWKSPDGSECNTIHLYNYGSFSSPFRSADFPENMEQWLPDQQKFFGENEILLSDAYDHAVIVEDASVRLKKLQAKFPEHTVQWTHYHDLPVFQKKDLPVVSGEMIFPTRRRSLQIAHTLSSRYDLKKNNDLLRNRLELETEPMAVSLGTKWSRSLRGMLDLAWKQYLRNQPHDSICGCSIDEVHRAMTGRFLDVQGICDFILSHFIAEDRSSFTGAPEAGVENNPSGEYTVRIFNPLPFSRSGTQEIELKIPHPYALHFAEPRSAEYRASFRIYTEEGEEIPYSLKSIRRNVFFRFYKNSGCRCDIHTVLLNLTLPAHQWTTLKLRPSATKEVRFFGTLRTKPNCAENDRLRMTLHENGTFDVLDKRNGHLYAGLNSYVIDRESGDGWCHVTPDSSREVIGGGFAQTEVLFDTFNGTGFRIIREFKLPESVVFRSENMVPAEQETVLRIVTDITLTADSDILKVHTQIPDMPKDCRIRLRIPTGIQGNYFAGQAFAVMERPSGRITGKETECFREPEQLEKNFDRFIGKRDEKGGIALLPFAGLHEGAGLADEEGNLLVTLCRTFRRTVSYSEEPDGELPGGAEFDYCYSFFGPESGYAEMEKRSQEYRAKLIIHRISDAEIKAIPERKNGLELTGDLTLSALKPADDGQGMILRLVNLSSETASGICRFRDTSAVCRCNLLEEPAAEPEICDTMTVTLSPWEIVTLSVIRSEGLQHDQGQKMQE